MKCILSLLVVSLLLISCGRYFAPDRNLKREVTKSEVVGVWVMHPDSMAHLVRDGYVADSSIKYEMTFREDGTMTYDSTYSESFGLKHVKADGKYFLARSDDGAAKLGITLWFDGMDHGYTFSFTEQDGRIMLWTYYGDPDSWEFIEYTKKSS